MNNMQKAWFDDFPHWKNLHGVTEFPATFDVQSIRQSSIIWRFP